MPARTLRLTVQHALNDLKTDEELLGGQWYRDGDGCALLRRGDDI
jgi:hypothetical protein